MAKRLFYGSVGWGLVVTALTFGAFLVITSFLGRNGDLGTLVASGGKVAGTILGLFWVFVFPRARKKYRARLADMEAASRRELDQKKPLAVSTAFFEAICPRCSSKHAIFEDDPERLACGCGARLIVRRSEEGGVLELTAELEAQYGANCQLAGEAETRGLQALSASLLANRKVKTLDGQVTVYKSCELKSAVVNSPPKGTEIQLGSISVIDGREWVEAILPNGDRGYALSPNLRSHCA